MGSTLEVIFGPPGTGKTTELSRLIHDYVAEEGSASVLVCAYTRTAAQELIGRDLPLESAHVGTLHSHCYHALDNPPIAESFYKDWNTAYPVYTLSPPKSLLLHDEPLRTFKLFGDECLHALNVLRHRMVSQDRWPPHIQMFHRLWRAWKDDNRYWDFTDLIDRARVLLPLAPGHPQTIIIDEAQDLSLLQWDLLQRWGMHATRVIAAGDDDQALYRWAGADFHPLLSAPARRVLPQSYRLPQHIQAWALRHTNAIRDREPKTWHPRNTPGILTHDVGSWQTPEMVVMQVRGWLEAPWDTVACIAPCGYMLEPLVDVLESDGIPFSNRWRRTNSTWNPLAPPHKGIGIVQRLLNFLRPPDRLWTWEELATWFPLIRSDGVLRRGAKSAVASHINDTRLCTYDDLTQLFLLPSLAALTTNGVDWLANHVLQTHAKRLAYPIRVYKQYGRAGLTEEPRLTIGTAHSLKGAEAHIVVFWQDFAKSQHLALCEGGAEADDIHRMCYVACTRAKEELHIMSSGYAS